MSEAHGTVVSGEISAGEQSDGAAAAARPGFVLALVALLWAAAMLLSARITITGREQAEMEVTSTAYALPGAISACLVAGAAMGLLAVGLLTRGGRRSGPGARFGIAVGAGLVTGLPAALTMISINTEGWLYAVVGGTLAAAATLGGAVAGARATRVVAAACWAGLAVFAVAFGLNLFQAPLLRLFGAGGDQAAQAGAVGWFTTTQSVASGLTAGLMAYLVLRRARRAGSEPAWPWYAVAGAGPGIVLAVAEGLARTAGARVLDLAGRVSELELAAQELLSGARMNNALLVIFIGAIVAIIAVGRTIRAPEDA